MVLLAIFRLKGAGDGFGSPSLRCSSSVMTLIPEGSGLPKGANVLK